MASTMVRRASILSRISGLESPLTTFWRRSLAKTECAVREESPSTTLPVASGGPPGLGWLP
jgi:hypothetical protein